MGVITPNIRFKGFTDDWEQRKLTDILERRIEHRMQSEEYPRLAFASGQGVIPLSERKTNNREQLTKDEFTKNYLVTELDDIVYNPANVKYGAIDRNKCGRGLISPIYVTFTTTETPGFVERIVTSHDFQQRALRFEEGTVTKRQSVNPEDFVSLEILVSPFKEEQKKISSLFDNLDNLITLHQRKCDEAKELKKYMLQKMFPQEGQFVPEIRFAGFTDDWEQRKLKDVVTEIKRTDENSDAPVMMITAENGFINQSDRYSTNNAGQSLKKYILLEKGELAYNHGASKLRPYGSCFALTTTEKARIPFVYHCFTTVTENPEFLSIVLNGKAVEKQLRRIVSSGARMDGLLNISFEQYTSIPVLLPKKAEQDRITIYFRNLDNLITFHQQKCDEMKELKKYMLKNMFPQKG